MSVKLTISVTDIATVLSSFSHIRVKRSIVGVGGPFDLITGEVATAATLLAPTAGPYSVSGLTLEISVDRAPAVTVTFTGTDPLTAAALAGQINAELGAANASNVGASLQLASLLTGTESAIEVTGGTALAALGWSANDRDVGEDENIPLTPGKELYDYVDDDGDGDFFYVVHYHNPVSNLSSNDSEPFQGEPSAVVGTENLSRAIVDLADTTGFAIADQEISLYTVHQIPLVVDGFQIGLARAPKVMITDNLGHAEELLVRGSRVKVVFEGTSVIRDITVPDEEEFDLLALLAAAPDPFNPALPAFPFAIRRTL